MPDPPGHGVERSQEEKRYLSQEEFVEEPREEKLKGGESVCTIDLTWDSHGSRSMSPGSDRSSSPVSRSLSPPRSTDVRASPYKPRLNPSPPRFYRLENYLTDPDPG